MPDILSPFLKKHKVDFNLEEKIFLLVANRLHDPKSEHGTARWLEKTGNLHCRIGVSRFLRG
ncbi:hypothetical protein DRJ04_07380 [Candidatus Aerophobetes bacterium]|uniref:Uncharacterized protein n=1 Tax=Aerophobetes bacterium TaxID=2030807 RepID=A0A662DAC5_UNCAE|nr:MAG: hypothetical protein DRJ04_07380 [Candidatus Aerophobetes bacterium]